MPIPPFPTIIVNGNKRYWYLLEPTMEPATQIDLSAGGFMKKYYEYETLVPEGYTGEVKITHAGIQIQGYQKRQHGFSFLNIESPKYSFKWKSLAWAHEDEDNGYGAREFPHPVVMVPGETVCLQLGWLAREAGPSWRYGPSSQSRAVSAFMHYELT